MMTETMLSIYIFGIGAIVGSFLNVLIYRLPKNRNFVTGRSSCPHCDALIAWYDNIPILSFVFLRGRCRHCRGAISLRYPLVELVSAGFFLLAFQLYGLSAQTAVVSVFFCLLFVITVIDFQHYIIPDAITIPGMILGLEIGRAHV
jgi:leader peptidase (prepilin peptidase)/N-methyltransferase